MSREDWRKWLPYAPVASVILVIVIAVALDLALGGPTSAKPQNEAPPPDALRATDAAAPVSPTPWSPSATETATPGPTSVPDVVARARDQTRISDLYKIAVALQQYKSDKGKYPTTEGNLQSACAYVDLDALCKIKDYLDPIPSDPDGDPVTNGYWYVSDGDTFTLVAGVDSSVDASPSNCDQGFYDHTKKQNLYCLKSAK